MKSKVKLTDQYLASLPTEMVDNIQEELKTAEIDPYLGRKGFAGLEIDETEERVSIARMSTRDIDSDNEIVMPYALDVSRYQSNPVVLLNHSWGDPPIGSASAIRLHDRGIDGKIHYADTKMGNEVWSLVRDRHLRANSIGFLILDYVARSHPDFGKLIDKALRDFDEFTPQHADRLRGFIRRGILLENSVVTIPANANALMEAVATRSMTMSPEMINLLHLDISDVADGEQVEAEAHAEDETVEIVVDDVQVTTDPSDDLESVETITVYYADDDTPAEAPVAEDVAEDVVCEPKLVARLVRRAKPKEDVDPKQIAKMAQDILELKRGKV